MILIYITLENKIRINHDTRVPLHITKIKVFKYNKCINPKEFIEIKKNEGNKKMKFGL